MNIVLLSNHYYRSSRRAGFHHLADAWHAAGHEITFATTGLSWISYARRDFRTRYDGIRAAHGILKEERPGFHSYVHFTPWHPHALVLPWLDRLAAPLMSRYGGFALGSLEERIRTADMIVYESSPALFLFERCKALAPAARHVYRVSDDLRLSRSAPPCLLRLEMRIAPEFDLVSVPYEYLARKFAGFPNLRHHYHGVHKALFDACRDNPYAPGSRNAVFVGLAYLDMDFLMAAARRCPEANYHVIGLPRPAASADNIVWHGEVPFAETIPFLKFADVGLHVLTRFNPHAVTFTDSLKVLQYRYCGLPIVAPDFLDLRREGVFYYAPGDEGSIAEAVRGALASGCDPARAAEVRSWPEVARDILSDATRAVS